jgi:centromere/kinetochore protein ZW10
VETQAISRSEGKQLNGDSNNEWDAAWSDEEQDRTALERARRPSVQEALQDDPGSWTTEALHDNLKEATADGAQDDDVADAWGWGDDDAIDEEGPSLEEAKIPIKERMPAVREVTLTEKYTISSMPDPVLKTIKQILEDGATLTQDMYVCLPVIVLTC